MKRNLEADVSKTHKANTTVIHVTPIDELMSSEAKR